MPRTLALSVTLLFLLTLGSTGIGQEAKLGAPVEKSASEPVATFCDACGKFDFAKVPPTRPLPRMGLFPIWPDGPGFYSLQDACNGNWRESPPKSAFPPYAMSPLSFFDADWRYMDDPSKQKDWIDGLKRMHVGNNWLVSTGGQTWFRYQNEYNARLTNANNVSTLVRVRPYLDVWYRDRVRIFAEFIYAESLGEDLPPLVTDVNRGDFQNLFVELNVGDIHGKPTWLRVGRQEITLGSQRLVGTPDWANTRRTWDGVRLIMSANIGTSIFSGCNRSFRIQAGSTWGATATSILPAPGPHTRSAKAPASIFIT